MTNNERDELSELAPKNEPTDASGADETVKGGGLLSSAQTSAPVLKQSAYLSTSVDPGKVQGFECNGRA